MALPLRWKGRPGRFATLASFGALAILGGVAIYASRGAPVGAPASILSVAAPAPSAGSSLPPASLAEGDRGHPPAAHADPAEERQRVLRLIILYGAYGAGARPFGPFR